MCAGQFSIDPTMFSAARMRDILGSCKFSRISTAGYDEGPHFNAIASSHAIPEGIFRVNAGYGILSTSEEGSEDRHTEHMGNL